MIRELLDEIERSTNTKLLHVGLLAALTVPDIAGALDSESGYALPEKYKGWFDEYIAPKYFSFGVQLITGEDCYNYRCAILHQGRSQRSQGGRTQRPQRYSKTMFHFTKQENVGGCGAYKLGQTLAIDVPKFCSYMVNGAYTWLDLVEDTPRFKANSAHAMELFQLSFGD